MPSYQGTAAACATADVLKPVFSICRISGAVRHHVQRPHGLHQQHPLVYTVLWSMCVSLLLWSLVIAQLLPLMPSSAQTCSA